MQVNFPLALKQLDDKNFPVEEMREFVEKVGIQMVLLKYGAGARGTKRLLQKILSDPKMFDKVLFTEDPKQLEQIKKLAQKTEFKVMVTKSIDENYRAVSKELNRLFESNKELYQVQLLTFLSFIGDEESDVGLNIVKALGKMLRKDLLQFMEDGLIYEHLYEGMKHENDIIRMRFMEVSMEVSNSSEKAHQILIEKGILDLCIQQVVTQDILLRLAAVEVISKIGNKPYNSKYLVEHQLMKSIISDAFNPKEELYVKKYLALLISKFLASGTMEFSLTLRQHYLNLLAQLFFEGMDEEKYAAMDIISHLAMTQEGIQLILVKQEIFQAYMSFSQVTKEQIKLKFLASFSSFFYKNEMSEKQPKMLSNIMICYGNFDKIRQIMDFKQAPQTLEDLRPAIESMFTVLYQPFPEVELEMLNLVKNIVQWEVLCKWFIGHAKAIDYLTAHYAKNGEIYQAKQDIIEIIINLCNNVFNKEHTVFKKFADQLVTTIQDIKKNGNKPKKEEEDMEYALQNM